MPKLKRSYLQIVCLVSILLLALLLLWRVNANSNQAAPALLAQVYFDGEYRVAEGAWQEIKEGEHIPANKGDVTLRGNFHMLTPDGEYIGIYSGDLPVALYTDHINLTIFEGENEAHVIDMENPLFGMSSCGKGWTAYSLSEASSQPIEIIIHNPHKFGNETAIDEFLSNIALWSGFEFEKGVLETGAFQRNWGLFFFIVALGLLGIALFSALIHIKTSKLLWVFGMVCLFAGIYLAYSAGGVSFWRGSIASSTTILGCSMMLYMLFLSVGIVHYMDAGKKLGTAAVVVMGAVDALLLVAPVISGMHFYDTLPYWVIAQMAVNAVLLGCVAKEFFCKSAEVLISIFALFSRCLHLLLMWL